MSGEATISQSTIADYPPEDNWLSRMARAMIGVDLRSLAAFRIALGAIVIVDLAFRAPVIGAFYTDTGVLPRWALLQHFSDPWQWSLHTATGKSYLVGLIFLFHAFCAAMMMVGYRTRLFTILTWVLTISLQNRNGMILDGGDVILRLLLFWSMFLPLHARASVDRATASDVDEDCHQYWSFATVALIVQICLIYWYNAWSKYDASWLTDRSAVYYALSIDAFQTPLGQWLREFPTLLQWLTAGTLLWEFWGPFLLFVPFITRYTRIVAVLGFVGMHVGFALTLALGVFPWVGVIAWLPFVPGCVWQWLGRRSLAMRLLAGAAVWRPWLRARCMARPLRVLQSRIGAAVCIGLTVYIVLWNVRGFNDANMQYYGRYMSYRANILGMVLRLDQKWAMFAPFPLKDDGWYVIPAVLNDGTTVDLWTDGKPVTWTKPDDVAANYRNQRWRKYMLNLWQRGYADHRPYLARYLARDWNARHGSDKQVQRLVIYYMREVTLPDYQTAPVERVRLWWLYTGDVPETPLMDISPPEAGEFTPAADELEADETQS